MVCAVWNVRLFCVGIPRIFPMGNPPRSDTPSVQASVPVVAGMTSGASCWACAGHAMAASSRRGTNLAGGGGGEASHGESSNGVDVLSIHLVLSEYYTHYPTLRNSGIASCSPFRGWQGEKGEPDAHNPHRIALFCEKPVDQYRLVIALRAIEIGVRRRWLLAKNKICPMLILCAVLPVALSGRGGRLPFPGWNSV